MHQGDDLPVVSVHASLEDAVFEMTSGRLGMTVITDNNNRVVGVFTDGDLRRSLNRNLQLDHHICNIMTKEPKCVNKDTRASDALSIMNEKGISQLLILDDMAHLLGIITIHDLLQAGVS